MKEKLFEIGAKLEEGWSADNRGKNDAESERETLPPSRHRLWFSREKRRGKWVTLCGPFFLEKGETAALLKRLKKRLGTGGTMKGETMEFQGEIGERLREALEAEGFGFRG
ncbi:translation initiation factor [Nitratifractor sp.]